MPQDGGTGLKKKIGPLPLWGWLVVGLVAYYLYKKSQSAASSTSTTSTAGTTPQTATVTLPGGYSYSGTPSGAAAFTQSVGGQAAQGQQPPVAPGQGSTGTSPGSGAGTPGTAQPGALSGMIGSQPGEFSQVPTFAANQGYAAAGVQQYQELSPGVFTVSPVTQSGGYTYAPSIAGTPTFVQVPAA